MKKFLKNFLIIIILAIITFLLISFIHQNQTSEPQIDSTNSEAILEEPEPNISFTMAAIGDVMCHNTQYIDAYDKKTGEYDFSYVYENIKQYIQDADIAVANLETTFARQRTWL